MGRFGKRPGCSPVAPGAIVDRNINLDLRIALHERRDPEVLGCGCIAATPGNSDEGVEGIEGCERHCENSLQVIRQEFQALRASARRSKPAHPPWKDAPHAGSRIEPFPQQAFQVLGKWLFDQHWLVIDRDDSVLLVASSSKVNEHVIVRIDVSGAPKVDGVRIAPFAFAAPPAVDTEGYSLIIARKNKLPKLVRLATLDARPGRWLDVGGCL